MIIIRVRTQVCCAEDQSKLCCLGHYLMGITRPLLQRASTLDYFVKEKIDTLAVVLGPSQGRCVCTHATA